MLIIEIEDSPNRSQIHRLQENGFSHDGKRDYIDMNVPGLPYVEVWTKNDGQFSELTIGISDLPEIED